MAHAKPSDLEDIKMLLAELRKIVELKEKSMGCFYLKGKGILHFHVKGNRRFAHVFNGVEWKEVDIKSGPSDVQQKRLLGVVREMLPLKD